MRAPRLSRWLPLVLLAGGAWAVALVGNTRGERGAHGAARPSSAARAAVEDSLTGPEPTAAREVVPAAPRLAAPVVQADSAPRPPLVLGRGAALLRVRVVAVETEERIAGATLDLLQGDDEEREWSVSEQTDPSRGVEGDWVTADAAGCGEFVVRAGVPYVLRGSGEGGRAAEGRRELPLLAEGEVHEVTLALATARTRGWTLRVVARETQQPLADVEVVARVDAERWEDTVELVRGRTDDAGEVTLLVPDFAPLVAVASLPGRSLSGARIRESRGEESAWSLIGLGRAGRIDALVRGLDGKPAEGIEVRVSTPGFGLGLGACTGGLTWSRTTDSAGRLHLEELPSQVDLRLLLHRGDRVVGGIGSPPIRLEPGEVRPLVLELASGCRVTGRVVDSAGSGLADVLLSLAGGRSEPVDRASGVLGAIDRHDSALELARVRTDARGAFEVPDVPAGAWRLAPARSSDLADVGLYFEIEESERARALELRLDRGLFLRGTVLDPAGRPTYRAWVECRGVDEELREVQIETGDLPGGRFEIGPLAAGTYVLTASSDDPLWASGSPVRVRAGEEGILVPLRWGGVVRGHAVDARTREQVPACVQLGSASAGGAFEFESLAPGRHVLLARTRDGRAGTLTVTLGERQERDVEIPVVPGIAVAVRARAPQGVHVRCELEWNGLWIGRFLEDGDLALPPGTVTVRWFRGDSRVPAHEESRRLEEGSAPQELVWDLR